MMPSLWYDKQGNQIDAREFERLRGGEDNYKRIGGTIVMSSSDPSIRLWVSTVWLGLDHSFTPGSPPMIFETMVFKHGGGGVEEECHRYVTEGEAQAGHKVVVDSIMEKTPNAVIMEDSSGEGFFLSPEERRAKLAELAIQANELMAELEPGT